MLIELVEAMGCIGSKASHIARGSIDEQSDGNSYNEQDYDDLIYLANKREIKVTIRTSTKAGIVAGLAVMGGVIVAGPVGAAVGGSIGTAAAVSMSRNVVGLNKLLEDTPVEKRGEVVKIFTESFQEEFKDTIENNAELKLLMRGGTPISVVRYMVERDIIQSEHAKKLDGIMTKVSGHG